MSGTRRLQQGLLLAAGALALAVVAVGLSGPEEGEDELAFWFPQMAQPPKPQAVAFVASTVVSRPVSELEQVWRSTSTLPLVLRFLNKVEVLDAQRMRWTLRSTLGVSLALELRLEREIPGSLLLWEVSGEGVVGTVRVEHISLEAAAGEKNEMTVGIDLRTLDGGDMPPAPLETFFGEQPARRLADDLRRLAHGLERGMLKVA